MLALGTANDWIGRTSDFVGMGSVLTVLALAWCAWLIARPRVTIGAAVMLTGATALATLATVEALALQPSPWWVLLLTTYAVVARRDLRRAMRRSS